MILFEDGRFVRRSTAKQSVVVNDFTVIVDEREQHPFPFQGFFAKGPSGEKPLVVPTVVKTIKTGDYSIEGFEDAVTIERKSLSDLYGSLGGGRERLEREFERMSKMQYAALVCESPLRRVMEGYDRSNLNPLSIYGTVVSWQIKYGVHWWWCESRRDAETTTFKLLQAFFKQLREGGNVKMG